MLGASVLDELVAGTITDVMLSVVAGVKNFFQHAEIVTEFPGPANVERPDDSAPMPAPHGPINGGGPQGVRFGEGPPGGTAVPADALAAPAIHTDQQSVPDPGARRFSEYMIRPDGSLSC